MSRKSELESVNDRTSRLNAEPRRQLTLRLARLHPGQDTGVAHRAGVLPHRDRKSEGGGRSAVVRLDQQALQEKVRAPPHASMERDQSAAQEKAHPRVVRRCPELPRDVGGGEPLQPEPVNCHCVAGRQYPACIRSRKSHIKRVDGSGRHTILRLISRLCQGPPPSPSGGRTPAPRRGSSWSLVPGNVHPILR